MTTPHERGSEPSRPRRTITPLSTPAIRDDDKSTCPLDDAALRAVVRAALQEDEAFNDLTTLATVHSGRRQRATLVARGSGVVAGIPLAIEAFLQLDPKVTIRVNLEDGARVEKGTPVLYLNGHARGLLSAERVALNFMQRLSGIATLTRKYVDAVRGTGTRILDTRKTTPGWRRLEKYAVRVGGGMNHRTDLASAILIKDNHLAAVDGDIAVAVQRCRALAPPGTKVEVECETREQVEAAVKAGADIIMLDNMSVDLARECVELAAGRAILEASGRVALDAVRRVAETGVNWISVGSLTHSPPALDLALDFEP